jgi:hypothetical protein
MANRRNDGTPSSKSAFPTPVYFQSEAETEALARRAARFQPLSSTGGPSTNGSGGVGRWFGDGDEPGSGLGMVPGAVGRKKMKGKGGLGYSGEVVMEVDPVSWLPSQRSGELTVERH